MIVNAGDTPTLTWHHADPDTGDPFDPATVAATLTFTDPAGTVSGPVSLTPVQVATGQWQVTPLLELAGTYIVRWTSTGPAEVDEVAIAASPAGVAAPWAPTLRAVAAHIPSRTRQVGTDTVPGDNYPAGTFNDLTMPTGDIVTELIERANAMVACRMGSPVMVAAYGVAQTAAALWAAYWVELGWPERDADTTVWAQLRADAEAMTVAATAVNLGAGGGSTGPDTDGTPPMPSTHTFPAPPRWADAWL